MRRRLLASLLLAAACGSGSQPVRSAPAEPTIQLTAPNPEPEVFPATLDGLVAHGSVAFPVPLKGVELGMAEASVRDLHARIASERLPTTDSTVRGARVVGGSLAAHESVMHTFILEDGVLHEVDIALPSGEAMGMLEQAWGAPESVGVGEEGRSTATWQGAGALEAVLIDVGDGKAILKYRQRKD